MSQTCHQLFKFCVNFQGSDHIVCSAISRCGTWLAYSDVDKVRLYNITLSPPSINKVTRIKSQLANKAELLTLPEPVWDSLEINWSEHTNLTTSMFGETCCLIMFHVILQISLISEKNLLDQAHSQGVHLTLPNLPKGPLLATIWTQKQGFCKQVFLNKEDEVLKVHILSLKGSHIWGPTPPPPKIYPGYGPVPHFRMQMLAAVIKVHEEPIF